MIIIVMSMSPGLRNVLEILAELAQKDTKTDVSENNIILHSGIPRSEAQIYLNELESRRLAEEVRPRPSGADFRLWRIKNKGLEALENQDLK
jgi:DNA-binding IclR family transcriptional regulator